MAGRRTEAHTRDRRHHRRGNQPRSQLQGGCRSSPVLTRPRFTAGATGAATAAASHIRQFCQRIDAAQASTARDYLQAVRRSVIEPTVTTKTTTRPGPDGQPVTETVKTVSPPDIKGALWWLERRLPALFGRRLEHAGRIDSTHDREKQRPLEILIVDPMTP